MFIFQHISSFISLIHPLSAVFISEETECRTFVIENKSISFSIFNYQGISDQFCHCLYGDTQFVRVINLS